MILLLLLLFKKNLHTFLLSLFKTIITIINCFSTSNLIYIYIYKILEDSVSCFFFYLKLASHKYYNAI